LDFALAPQRNRLLPMDNLEGLVRRVEEQRLFHGNLILGWILPDGLPKCQASDALNRHVKRGLAGLRAIGYTADTFRVLTMARCRGVTAGLKASTTTVIITMSVLTAACASSGARPQPFRTPDRASPAPSAAASSAEPSAQPGETTLIDTALSLRGVPYRNGGTDSSGFDCSGFTLYVFGRHGIALPRDTREQFQVGEKIKQEDIQTGDLVFFHTVASGVSHVGIAVNDDEFVHAPSTAGVVRVEHLSSAYWSKRFIAARRIGATPLVSRPIPLPFPGAGLALRSS